MNSGKNSAKTLKIKPMLTVVSEAKTYIKNRRDGIEKSLKTSSDKLNKAFMEGFDWGRIITIGGLSGTGKSTVLRQWIKDLIELNTDEQFDVLSFQFEMLGIDEVARDLSTKLGKPIKDIYSATNRLGDKEFKEVETALENLSKYPIFVVDNIGTVEEIKDTILYYASSNKLAERNRKLVITLDHSLLVKGKDGELEKQTLDNLMKTLVELKKYMTDLGLKVMFFVLSQLNRDIESSDRVMNPKLHYPTKNDLFGASSVYWSSDYVMILHQPSLLDGLGNWYGPARKNFPTGLPVYNPSNPQQPMVYLHIIKDRFGQRLILPMVNELERGKITDFNF